MASNQNNNPFANNPFGAQFQDFFRNMTNGFNNNQNPFDFQRISQIQQATIDSLTQANKALFDGIQKLVKSQSEFVQEQAQVAANIASKSLNAKTPEENIDTSTRYAQHYFDTNLQNIQNVAKSASDTSVKVFDIINKQAVDNLSELSNAASSKKKSANA